MVKNAMSNSIDTPMTGATEGKTGYSDAGGNQVRSLISVNDLTYVLEPDLSCAVNRTHKRHFFQSNEYRNTQNAICILNSGADYIDPRRSFLEFEVHLPDGMAIGYFGRAGSVANLIRQVTVSTRSGDEISRIADYAHFMNMMMPYQFDEQWFTQHGEMMGWQGCIYGDDVWVQSSMIERQAHEALMDDVANHIEDRTAGAQYIPVATDRRVGCNGGDFAQNTYNQRRFQIPLYLLSPFFQYNRLLPAMIMSGLRIEIEWADPVKAFVHMKQQREDITKYLLDGTSGVVQVVTDKGPKPISDVDSKKVMVDAHDVATRQNIFTLSNTEQAALRGVFVRPFENAITGFQIHKPIFNLCSVQLSDAVQRSLNELSAINGLEIVYCDYEKTEAHLGSQQNTATAAYIEVRKSCSRALKAYARVYDTGRDKSTDDSLRGDDFPFLEYQWQLGSLYFPNQSVKTAQEGVHSAYSVAPLAYNYFLDSIDKYHPASRTAYGPYNRVFNVRDKSLRQAAHIYGPNEGTHCTKHQVTINSLGATTLTWDPKKQKLDLIPAPLVGPLENYYETAYKDRTDLHHGQVGTYARDQHVLGVSLERSTLFNLAGVPVNNSRVLALRMRLWQPGAGEANTIHSTRFSRQGALTGAYARSACDLIQVGPTGVDNNPFLTDTNVNIGRGRRCLIYLKFVKLARVFLNNVEVEQ